MGVELGGLIPEHVGEVAPRQRLHPAFAADSGHEGAEVERCADRHSADRTGAQVAC
jgi:hypothetical protein